MNQIRNQISNEVKTDFRRIGQHESFTITHDLNMVQVIRVITLDKETERPLLEVIQGDASIPAQQKQAAFSRYSDQIVTRQTDGAFVNAKGEVVSADAEGAISQRDFFQALTLGDLKKMGLTINDKTPVTSLIYALISNEMLNIDKRGGL